MTLRFIFRPGCSLCDAMWEELQGFLHRADGGGNLLVEQVDLAEVPDLQRRYGARIPVIEGDGREICAYFFDEEALLAYLSQSPITV